MIRAAHRSPLGALTLASDGAALTALAFADHQKRLPAIIAARPGEDDVTRRARAQLDEYFAGARHAFELPLAPAGSAFQQRVWARLRALEFGATTSYAELARALGAPAAARAVGAAVGRNPISIIIGCHRVLGADGALTGYAGGLARKAFLLDLERRGAAADAKSLAPPARL